MITMLYKVPEDFLQAVTQGEAEVIGAVIKETVSGRIMGHMQQTSAGQNFLIRALQGLPGAAGGEFSPLGMLTAYQNYQIGQKIEGLRQGVELLKGLQIGTLALSGINLGVSIAGFAMVLSRLRAMEGQLDNLMISVAAVTEDRREDDLRSLLGELMDKLGRADDLLSLKDLSRMADGLVDGFGRLSGQFEMIFRRDGAVHALETLSAQKLERLWIAAAALRLCQDSTLRLLFLMDELEYARRFANRQAGSLLDLFDTFRPEEYSRLMTPVSEDWQQTLADRAEMRKRCMILSDGLRGGVEGVAGQGALAQSLLDGGISGRRWLEAAEAEQEAPFQFLEVG